MTTLQTERVTLPVGSWQLDSTHSQIGFAIEYMTGRFKGSFSPVEATLTVTDDGSVALEGRTRVENVNVQDENLQAHLLSPEFFDAKRHPELSFKSASVAVSNTEISIDGQLTIKGIERPLTLIGTFTDAIADPYGRKRFGLEVSGAIDRHEFGLDWNAELPSGQPALSDAVTLSADLYFVEEA